MRTTLEWHLDENEVHFPNIRETWVPWHGIPRVYCYHYCLDPTDENDTWMRTISVTVMVFSSKLAFWKLLDHSYVLCPKSLLNNYEAYWKQIPGIVCIRVSTPQPLKTPPPSFLQSPPSLNLETVQALPLFRQYPPYILVCRKPPPSPRKNRIFQWTPHNIKIFHPLPHLIF